MDNSFAKHQYDNAVAYWAKLGVTVASREQAERLWHSMETVNREQAAIEAHRIYFYWHTCN